MNILSALINSAMMSALINSAMMSALINGAMMSAPLAALIWIGLRFIPPRTLSAAARYVVWWVALTVTVVLPVAFLPGHRAAHPTASVARIAPATPVEKPAAFEPSPDAIMHAPPIPSSAPEPQRFPLQIPAGTWMLWVSAVWALSAILLLLRLAISCALLSGRKARARSIPLALPASTRRQIRVAVSGEVSAPMAAGFLRPAILIPERLIGELDGSELDFIGLHEAAHFARRDDYALIVERLIEALFALHPIVRWIARQIDLEREIACDDRVVEATGRPLPYAACLTRVAELTGGVRASFAVAAATREGSHLTRRIEMLLDKTRRTGTRWLKTRLACALAVVSALAWMAARTPALLAFTTPLAVTTPPRPVPPVPVATAIETAPPQKRAPRLIAQAAPPQPPAPEIPVDAAPTSSPMVLEPVTVRDLQGRVVLGLKQENFRVLEDDVERQLTYFREVSEPASLGVVSQNPDGLTLPMQEELVQLQQTIPVKIEFIETADPKLSVRDAATPAVNRMRQGVQNTPSNIPSIKIDHDLDAKDKLSFYYSANNTQSLYSANNTQSLHRVVLVLDAQGVSEAASSSEPGVTVVSIPPGTNNAVQTIASFLGADYYVLGYTPMNPAGDGKYRRINVKLSPPKGLPPLTIEYRSGYFASEKPVPCGPLPSPGATCY